MEAGKIFESIKLKRRLVQLTFLVLIALALQFSPREFLPSSLEIGRALLDQLARKEVQSNILRTGYRVFLSTFMALILGIIIGVADHYSETVSSIFDTIFYPSQFVSEAVLTIVAIALIGLNPAIVYIVTVLAIVPDIFVATQVGIRNMDTKLMDFGRVYGDSLSRDFGYLVIPQVLPYIFTGLIRAHASAWDIIATVEVFLALNGIGYLVQNQFRLLNLPELFALVLGIIVFGISSDRILRKIKRKVDRRYKYENTGDRRLV